MHAITVLGINRKFLNFSTETFPKAKKRSRIAMQVSRVPVSVDPASFPFPHISARSMTKFETATLVAQSVFLALRAESLAIMKTQNARKTWRQIALVSSTVVEGNGIAWFLPEAVGPVCEAINCEI
jgi:hypothetical protein